MPAGSITDISSVITPEKVIPIVGVRTVISGTVSPAWHLPSGPQK